jgi:hypothetical protein
MIFINTLIKESFAQCYTFLVIVGKWVDKYHDMDKKGKNTQFVTEFGPVFGWKSVSTYSSTLFCTITIFLYNKDFAITLKSLFIYSQSLHYTMLPMPN